MRKKPKPADHEIFLEHISRIFGEEDNIHVLDAEDGGPRISIFVYRDKPERGMITGVTYGLSLCDHPAWKHGRPELIVSMHSTLLRWPTAALSFAATFRGEKPFTYGDIFTTDGRLAGDTKMDGFLVFAPAFLKKEDQSVQLSKYKIHFCQLYPIHRSELPIYKKIGLEKFWKHKDFDLFDPLRPPITTLE